MLNLYDRLYKEAILGDCLFRRYAAAIVFQNEILGIGHARTVDGNKCVTCKRMEKIRKYGEISEFFEDCDVIHAELCAILDCENKSKLEGAEIYLLGICCDGMHIYTKAFPCPNCYKVIQYVGIVAINVFTNESEIIRYEV